MIGGGRPVVLIAAILLLALPVAFGIIRVVNTGNDVRYLWLAAAAILGSFAAAMPLGRRASPPARITALQTTGAVAAGSVCAAAAGILLGTTANLGLAIVATSFGLCTGTGVMLAALARHPGRFDAIGREFLDGPNFHAVMTENAFKHP